ncbi:DNA translocase FtsK [Sphaerisporangium album]|nr:DNA translocase FtsK [Sphaerisporangium album]
MAVRQAAQSTRVQVNETHETSWDRVWARETSKILVYVPPWLVGALGFGLGWVFHVTLDSDDPDTVAWISVFMTCCSLVLSAITFGQSHARGPWGKTHTTSTTFLAGMWVMAATWQGPTHPVVGRVALVGGVTLALSWNIRSAIRARGLDAPGAISDKLAFLFGHGTEAAGMRAVQARTTKALEHKVEGDVQLDPGRHIADDLAKKIPYIESAMGLPPGSINPAADPDDASKAKVVISDPRVMKNPIPWPGPSRPGGSVAEPFRLALWQDLDEVAYVIVGHHLQMMGMTGAGKGFGGAWNYLAEFISRVGGAVFAGDITKGEQTLGPLRPALHRFETTKAGVKAMLAELQSKVKERTDHLASKGLAKWKPGCGLTYWLIWLEEFPDIYDALSDKEQESFLSMLKAIRSAGGTIVMSLQRSDYTQMPTLARGQLAKMCFGVENSADAGFGLSERQQDAGCRPELWTNAQPGMAYLDAPSIEEGRYAMPMRTFAWGLDDKGEFDDERANAAMRAYAATYPAAAKQVDETTAALSRITDAPSAPTAAADGPSRPPVDRDLLLQAVELVVTHQYASAAMLQRKLRIGFQDAGRLLDAMEHGGIVGPPGEDGAYEVKASPGALPLALAMVLGDPETGRIGLGQDDQEDPDDEDDVKNVATEYLKTDDPDPAVTAGPDDDIPDIPDGEPPWRFAPPGVKMTPEQRGQALLARLQELYDGGAREVSTGDFKPLWETTDISRSWIQKQMKRLSEAGIIGERDEAGQRYAMPDRPELP